MYGTQSRLMRYQSVTIFEVHFVSFYNYDEIFFEMKILQVLWGDNSHKFISLHWIIFSLWGILYVNPWKMWGWLWHGHAVFFLFQSVHMHQSHVYIKHVIFVNKLVNWDHGLFLLTYYEFLMQKHKTNPSVTGVRLSVTLPLHVNKDDSIAKTSTV